MYSKMHFAWGAGGNGLSDSSIPSGPIVTISPGSTSRMNSASIRSSAQVSEAKTKAPRFFLREIFPAPADEIRTDHAPRSSYPTSETTRNKRRALGLELRRCGLSASPLRSRDEMDDHLGVGGRLKDRAGALQFFAQQRAVDEIAIVRDGDRSVANIRPRTAGHFSSGSDAVVE